MIETITTQHYNQINFLKAFPVPIIKHLKMNGLKTSLALKQINLARRKWMQC